MPYYKRMYALHNDELLSFLRGTTKNTLPGFLTFIVKKQEECCHEPNGPFSLSPKIISVHSKYAIFVA